MGCCQVCVCVCLLVCVHVCVCVYALPEKKSEEIRNCPIVFYTESKRPLLTAKTFYFSLLEITSPNYFPPVKLVSQSMRLLKSIYRASPLDDHGEECGNAIWANINSAQ